MQEIICSNETAQFFMAACSKNTACGHADAQQAANVAIACWQSLLGSRAAPILTLLVWATSVFSRLCIEFLMYAYKYIFIQHK